MAPKIIELSKSAPENVRLAFELYLGYLKESVPWNRFLLMFFGHVDLENVTTIADVLDESLLQTVKELLQNGPLLWPSLREMDMAAPTVAEHEDEKNGEPDTPPSEDWRGFWKRHWRGIEAFWVYFGLK